MDLTEPFKISVMAGGLFVIFLGTMVDAPSYLKKVFLILRVGKGEYLDRNCKRVAALWMDEYTY